MPLDSTEKPYSAALWVAPVHRQILESGFELLALQAISLASLPLLADILRQWLSRSLSCAIVLTQVQLKLK